MRNWVKLALIVGAIAVRHESITQRLAAFGMSASLLLYLGLLLLFSGMLIATGWIARPAARLFWAIVFAVCALPITGFEAAGGETIGYFQFVTLMDSRSSAFDALTAFPGAALTALVSSAMVFGGIAIRPAPWRLRLPTMWALATPVIGALAISALLIARHGEGASGLPASWAGLGYSALYALDRSQGYAGPREPVRLARARPGLTHDIVLIVDESVAGHYLDVNRTGGADSGLSSPPPGWQIANFGLAVSVTNCSIHSNVALRYGGTRENYKALIGTGPSIWDYAHAAGYRTAYLYAQKGGQYENYMTDNERARIDRRFMFESIAAVDRDQKVADTLAGLINDGQRDFILVNKLGAHFPVHDGYPPAFTRYGPALPRTLRWRDDDDSLANRLSIIAAPQDWRRYRNSYRNMIGWSVGAFFKRLFAGADPARATIIYTSDHGQTFHERGIPGQTTHCRPVPEVEELVVPLIVIGQRDGLPPGIAGAAKSGRPASHFRIFPTLLDWMGYDAAAVRARYGEPLTSAQPDPLTYATDMYLGSQGRAKWHRADLSSVIRPPAGDVETLKAP